MNARERLLRACRNQPVDRPPVWLMRQAGRYLPEYRSIRSQYTFWEMLRTPELAVEVSLQPLRRFSMDAAILFSDILVVLDAMGIEVRYENKGPVIQTVVQSRSEVHSLLDVDVHDSFAYIKEAVAQLCEQLHPHTGVIGFSGAPFTLAAYLIQGGPSRDLQTLIALAQSQPTLYQTILSRISKVVTQLLDLQIQAGADLVQIFDTWGGLLSPQEYAHLALPYVQQIISALRYHNKPIILYIRNAKNLLEVAASSKCTVLSVDSSIDLCQARQRLDAQIGLQGNLDPARLKAPISDIRGLVQNMIRSMKNTGYIVNLGQGLTPDTPVEGVSAFVDAVKEWQQ